MSSLASCHVACLFLYLSDSVRRVVVVEHASGPGDGRILRSAQRSSWPLPLPQVSASPPCQSLGTRCSLAQIHAIGWRSTPST